MMLNTSLFMLLGIIGLVSATSFLTETDKNHLKSVFEEVWKSPELSKDLAEIFYGAVGYKHLGLEVPQKQTVCNFLKSSIKNKPTAQNLFHATSAGKALGCPLSSPTARQMLSDILRGELPLVDVLHVLTSAKNFGVDMDEPKLLKDVILSLKKDDSILSLGYALHIGSLIKGDVNQVYERIEDVIVQADEVDGKMLQFEGGLSLTSLVLTGVYKLCDSSKKPVPIKLEQVEKFSNYLMSRKTVQLRKGAYHLLEAVNILTKNKNHIPLSITLSSNVAVSQESPKVRVRVTNLMGEEINGLKLVAVSASEENSNKPIFANKAFAQVSGEKSLYEIDVMAHNPPRGFYKLTMNAEGSDSRLVGNIGAEASFKVLSAVAVKDLEIGTADSDQSSAPNLRMLTFPNTLSQPLEADQHQRLVIRFNIIDTYTSKPTRVHQAFVKLTQMDTQREIAFLAEPDSSDVYKFDFDVNSKAKDFRHMSGKYTLELLIGDATISNSIVWKLALVQLKFSQPAAHASSHDFAYKARPEIHHMFRQPDPMPPKIVSLAFTVLCLCPFLVLLFGWIKLGVNLKNFPFSVSAIVFHLGLGSIFVLFAHFWLSLNMFTTLRYLFGLAIVTFISGNRMLSFIANRKEK